MPVDADAMYTQDNRQIAIVTPLGRDVLLLKEVVVHEALGQPFSIEVELRGQGELVDPNKLLGENSTIRISNPLTGESRYFNGFWASFEQVDFAPGALKSYRGRLVPWLDLLRHTTDCKIFQDMSAPDIIKEIFRDSGLGEFEEELSGQFRTRDFCAQYRESSFDFVNRLMQEEGIYYYFTHEDGKHTLVMVDDSSAHKPTPDNLALIYRNVGVNQDDVPNTTFKWLVESTLYSGDMALRDFDYLKPASPVEGAFAIEREHSMAGFQIYDYPGVFVEGGDGEKLATVRLQSIQARHRISHGETFTASLMTGFTTTLESHPLEEYNIEYLVISSTLRATSHDFDSGSRRSSSIKNPLTVSFQAIPATEQFRTPLTTPRPVVRGPQTAVVVGPAGEEIYSDEHGRVKVKFHWDRYGKADETASYWLRVSQTFAGKQWGALFTPRIGQEVIVGFEEGDVDRPIITGRVYNGTNKTPYDMSSMPTLSTIKTNSSKGGGGFNELRFEDKKGDEQIYIHAQKNLDILVLNDRFEKIDNDRHLTVGNDKREKVLNNRHEIVEGTHAENIKKDRNVKIEGKEALEVHKSRSVMVKENVNQDFKKNFLTKVTNVAYTKAKIICYKGSVNFTAKVGGNFIAITPAGIKIKGKAIQIESSSKGVDIKAKKDIKMDAKGAIEGKALKDVKLAATANVDIKSTANTTVKATGNMNLESTGMGTFKSTAPGTVESSAILMVKGSLVKIN